MKLTSKITCIVVFLSSLLLIFAMGKTNVGHFKDVKHSIEEIYKDRLVVNGMIFELASLLHKKEIAIITSDKEFFKRTNDSINLQIEELIREFKETYLTSLEESTLLRFEKGTIGLKEIEKTIIIDNKKINFETAEKLSTQINSLKIDLKTLSGIQLAEGKRKLMKSDKAIAAMSLNQSFENYSMLVIGILILVVILIPGVKSTEKA